MKSITEILGGAQLLLSLTFDLQETFEEYLNDEHRAFLALLCVIEGSLAPRERVYCGRGRIPYHDLPFFRAFLAKAFLQIPTTEKLICRLKADANLRRICGFTPVASASTFSRRFEMVATLAVMDQELSALVRQYVQPHVALHIVRDSTAIEAREKPTTTQREVRRDAEPPRRRGRPRKNEPKAEKKLKRLARQARQRAAEGLKELNRSCCWGCKTNSQGNKTIWKGYKLHLDVTEQGVPVTAVVTGANVHDSQVAIPMEKLSERKVTHLYSLMDAAYDATDVRGYIEGKGRVALIDQNRRRGDVRPPMDPAQKQRFKIRSTVERANSHLKDWFFSGKVYVRGIRKVRAHLMIGVVCLAAVKILQHLILPQQEKEAA